MAVELKKKRKSITIVTSETKRYRNICNLPRPLTVFLIGYLEFPKVLFKIVLHIQGISNLTFLLFRNYCVSLTYSILHMYSSFCISCMSPFSTDGFLVEVDSSVSYFCKSEDLNVRFMSENFWERYIFMRKTESSCLNLSFCGYCKLVSVYS